jgi:hypothetical protein
MPPVGFEPAIPASERPQTSDLDRAAAGIGLLNNFVAEGYGRRSRHVCQLCVDFTHVLPYKTIKHGLPFFSSFDVCRYTRFDGQSLPKDFLQIAVMPSASLLWYCGSHPCRNVASYIFPSYWDKYMISDEVWGQQFANEILTSLTPVNSSWWHITKLRIYSY